MINIIIPVKNQSERLPLKDIYLLRATLDYVERECFPKSLDKARSNARGDVFRCYLYGYAADDVDALVERYTSLYPWCERLSLTQAEDTDHESATTSAIKRIGVQHDDCIVMLQPTQPARRHGLLHDAVQTLRQDHGGRAVISATLVAIDGRRIDNHGKRLKNQPHAVMLYDGAIYAGNLDNYRNWFTLADDSSVIINNRLSVCDIDTLDDLYNHLIFK